MLYWLLCVSLIIWRLNKSWPLCFMSFSYKIYVVRLTRGFITARYDMTSKVRPNIRCHTNQIYQSVVFLTLHGTLRVCLNRSISNSCVRNSSADFMVQLSQAEVATVHTGACNIRTFVCCEVQREWERNNARDTSVTDTRLMDAKWVRAVTRAS